MAHYTFDRLNTNLGGFTMSDRFLMMTTRLGCSGLYGFGENEHHSFKHDFNYQTWRMFSRDQPPRVSIQLGFHI